MDEKRVRDRVTTILLRTLGRSAPAAPRPAIVTELHVRDLAFGSTIDIPAGALITPLARQVMMDRHVSVAGSPLRPSESASVPSAAGRKVVALGADHAGFALKEELKLYLAELGYAVQDCGTTGTQSVDYPDYALAVAERLGTTRGALYKTLHDARQKRRGELDRRGFARPDGRDGP